MGKRPGKDVEKARKRRGEDKEYGEGQEYVDVEKARKR